MRLFSTLFILCVVPGCHMTTSTCDELLSSEDAQFCKGQLKVIYPHLVVDKCMIVPQMFREKISKDWGPPQIQLPGADEEKKYTLLMVDPDAPSRQKPSRAYWRHWLLVDAKGEALQRGDAGAVELSAYARPTPPRGTGLHRYQFLVFEQPEGQSLSLSPQENSSRGNWDPQAFVETFGLTGPVASLQFLTQNYKD
ncbi:phosphatidylethanolamine-binding protein 4 isoform X2 [Puntigrus tetrazona]|uniref:phosphatidylethanolamine-binding protein 4 isoform X2 n=1 Tax=Puntigrus tetrazona TaxID=1606681 RepID=UPI001C8938D0|nr:phosphatidylethanolamine-binding protein 4 isoform X2 [Puntigrus tetrazona]